jgi:hypothetical protein
MKLVVGLKYFCNVGKKSIKEIRMMRFKTSALVVLICTIGVVAQAGPKEDFLSEVERQCKISKEEAIPLATPGREGNVMQFKLCSSDTITVTEKCTIKCVKAGGSL